MMTRGKRDTIPLSQAELPGTDGEGPHSSGEGRQSTSEEEGHLLGLPRDDLTKSMSGSSVSSYHSALCSDGTETFKDCLEFLDNEGMSPRDVGTRGGRAEGGPARAPSVPSPPVPLARPRQAQLSIAAKNSPAPGQGGRMGPLSRDRQPATTATTASRELTLPRQPGGMLVGGPSDSDEADGEVRALTARAFHSLSGPPGARLDMCSSHTSSSLSNSLSEDGGQPRRWPAAGGESRGTAAALHGRVGWPFTAGVDGELLGVLGKEQFECVDVELESGEARKGHGKKRTVPKRQILLKRKERKEVGFGTWGDGAAPQPLPPARKEPPSKGRAIGEDFRLNYKQFMKMASLDADADKTRAASCLVKNVLAKKMQYEQRIKMEQKGLRGSSTSSGPSSAGTDLLGDGLEGKSSSLSRSDCSFSAEDLRGGGMPVSMVATVAVGDATTSRPTKGVVLSEATRENVCKLKKTFNELNERMKYQEVLEGHQLPSATKEPASERIHYRQARTLFEARPEVGKALDVAPRFQRAPKPWPSLKQRAIRPSHPQTFPLEANSLALPTVPPRRQFTSRAQEVRLVPQSCQEEKPPAVPHHPPSPSTPAQGSPPAVPPKTEDKGKGRIPRPRDVRKLVKSSYSLCFGSASTSSSTAAPASAGEPPPATPLVIHCTSVCRRETATQPGDEEALAAASQEPAPAHAEGPAKLTSGQPLPTRSSPIHITRIQATQRGVTTTEGPAASPPHRERSELKVSPRAPAAEGVPHVETHLHVLVGRRSPAAARESSPAQSSTMLRTEKTVLLPPPSPTEGKDERGHGGTGGLHVAEGPESTVQRHGSSDNRDPQATSPAGSSVYPQPEKPAERSPPKAPTSEQVSTGSSGSAGSTGPTAPFQAGEAGTDPSGRLPEQREAGEHLPKWPAATEPYLPASPAENSNYLAIPVKAPRSSPMPKLPSVPNLASTSFGTPVVPKPVSESFGSPLVPNPASTSFGTTVVPNLASTSFGTPTVPMVPNLASTSFGTPTVPMVPNLASTSFGTPTVPMLPNLASTSFGTPTVPMVPNPASMSIGTPTVPMVPNPARMSIGTPTVPNMTNSSFGYPSASSLASTSFGAPLVSNPTNKSFGTPLIPYPGSTSLGNPLVPNLCGTSFGTPLVPNPASISFGTPLVPNPSSISFGTSSVLNPSRVSFGTPLVPNPSSVSFGISSVPNPSSVSFGTPLVPDPSTTSFGTPSVPNLANSSLGIPLVSNSASSSFGPSLLPNPVSSSFGSPLVTNPVPASLGYPSVSNKANSSFGSPLASNLASAPQGTSVFPLASGEVPWGKPSPEPPLPRPPEGLASGEHLMPLPPAQPQPRLEDTPHFLRRTDGALPSSKSTTSPTTPFVHHLPAHRRMLVDPDSGKCYYMEPPRQPQLKTLYDPETGQYLEVLIPSVASHAGLYQAPFNPLVMAPGVYTPPYVPYSSFPGLQAPLAPTAPSVAHPDLPAAENPGISGSFSPAPKSEGPPTAGGPDCGYLESLYYIPTGMRASPGPSPSQPPARASPAAPEKGPLLQM